MTSYSLDQPVKSSAAADRVVLETRVEHIIPIAAREVVSARTAMQVVITRITVEHIITAVADELIVPLAAVERILGDLEFDRTPRLLVFNKADRVGFDEARDIASARGARWRSDSVLMASRSTCTDRG